MKWYRTLFPTEPGSTTIRRDANERPGGRGTDPGTSIRANAGPVPVFEGRDLGAIMSNAGKMALSRRSRSYGRSERNGRQTHRLGGFFSLFNSNFPAFASQSRIFPPAGPVARMVPSGEKARGEAFAPAEPRADRQDGRPQG